MNERPTFPPRNRTQKGEALRRPVGADFTQIAYDAVSRASKNHSENEDAWAVDIEKGLFVVADGVGSQTGARAASQLVAKLIVEYLGRAVKSSGSEKPQFRQMAIGRAIQFVHRVLLRKNQNAKHKRDRMVTTIAGLWFDRAGIGEAIAFNVGDSPIYRISTAGSVQVLSAEHSLYQAWLDRGGVGESPSRKYITQAIGAGKTVSPHILSFDPERADRFVVCSDGLADCVTLEELGQEISAASSPGAACQAIFSKISHENQSDDVTLIVCGASGSF
jgi:serine/threonine protein phosphatase PrpC